jgi:hypothetical protein
MLSKDLTGFQNLSGLEIFLNKNAVTLMRHGEKDKIIRTIFRQ